MPHSPAISSPAPGPMPPWTKSGFRRIGRYLVGPSLGKGGMGEVFEAWDPILGRRVALKLLGHGSAMAMARFFNEARLQARVDHPNVCRVFDVDVTGDIPLIAMQLVTGPNLKEAGLDPRSTLKVMRLVCEAIHAAHGMNLVHRDLKPSNIVLEHTPMGSWIPYVCDFGLAKDLEAQSMTQSSQRIGTPGFMAPEQVDPGRIPVGPASDIYSIGATLRILLEGGNQSPSTQPDAHHLDGQQESRQRPVNSLTPDVRIVVDRCMKWDPEDRYPSAAAVGEDLRRCLDGERLLQGGWGYRKRVLRWARRSPGIALLIGCLVLLSIGIALQGARSRKDLARQARIGEHFLATIKDLQYSMRVERMLPAHDLRPAFQRVRERMSDVEATMAGLGAPARGPGHYALGWGHLLLREPDEALRELTLAWSAPYHSPDVACALAKARCEVYQEELPLARQAGAGAVEALRRKHLLAARQDLHGADGAILDIPALVQAELEVLDDHPEQALLLTRKVRQTSPWAHEADVWEAAALYHLGFGAQREGRYPYANATYAQADLFVHRSQDRGRSDELALKIELNRSLAWVAMQEEVGQIRDSDFGPIMDLADHLLALNPDWLPAIADKLTVIWRRADLLRAQGADPIPLVRAGLEILDKAGRLPRAARLLHRDRINLVRILAIRTYEKGGDPRPMIMEAVAGGLEDEFTADLLVLHARSEMDHGVDPGATLQRALHCLDHPSFDNSRDYGVLEIKGITWTVKGQWDFFHGQDPKPAFKEAGRYLEEAACVNPQSVEILICKARLLDLAFRQSIRIRAPDPAMLESAMKAVTRAVRIKPKDARALRASAQIELLAAEWALENGKVASHWLSEAKAHLEGSKRLDSDNPHQTVLELREALARIRGSRRLAQDPGRDEAKALRLISLARRRGVALDEVKALEERLRLPGK